MGAGEGPRRPGPAVGGYLGADTVNVTMLLGADVGEMSLMETPGGGSFVPRLRAVCRRLLTLPGSGSDRLALRTRAEPQQRQVTDAKELQALGHPVRQQILRHLRDAGPATSTTLARELGTNSGIMSYHLRLLEEHDFIRELAGRGRGRERWWEIAPDPVWIPRETPAPSCSGSWSTPRQRRSKTLRRSNSRHRR